MMANRPTAVSVKPTEDYHLLVTFDNREQRLFDVSPYIRGNWFGQLRDKALFDKVRIGGLSVEWPDGQDICPDRLYYDSIPI